MRIKKTYTVTESEKNRILGLHNNVKNLLREGTGEICEDCGKVHEGACGGETYEDYELEESLYDDARREFPTHPWEKEREVGEAYDGRTWEDQIKDLSKGIPTPGNPSGGMTSGGGDRGRAERREGSEGGKNRTKGPVKTDSKGRVMNPKDQPSCSGFIIGGGGGGCCYCHGVFQSCPCGPVFDVEDMFGEGKKSEMRETALPTGWTMRTKEEIEEENIMDDLYEVWSGHEDDKALRESMMDDGTIKEQWYELPLRFGNKRLTESQLLRMIDTIIK